MQTSISIIHEVGLEPFRHLGPGRSEETETEFHGIAGDLKRIGNVRQIGRLTWFLQKHEEPLDQIVELVFGLS